MRKTINFGKIDYFGCGIKINLVEVELKLTDDGCFSCCCYVWNSKKTDMICCGQCLDSVLPLLKDNEKFKTIYRLWEKWHLNDMHAGTEAQEKALSDHFKDGVFDYTDSCEYLKSIGLYNDNGYEYGSRWLKREIDECDLKLIKELIEE